MTPRPWRRRAATRALDLVGASVLLLVALPLMLCIAGVLLAGDRRAPVLFAQPRCGRGGRPFRLYKFRTMVPNADELKEALRERSVSAWPDFRLPDDPRVTRTGRVLRRTSLDELPQLVNVLRGHMSLVGPRPTSFLVDTYDLWQTERLELRPGLTGPWQVHGRTSLDFTERCRLEIAYFRTATLRDDLRLLIATVGVLLRRTGVA